MEQKPRSAAGETMGWLFGAILIAVGAIALANQFLPFHFSDIVVALMFGGVGVAFFSLSARSPANWWAMIPGYVFLFVGAVIVLARIGLDGDLMGMFVVSAVGLPFLYVFLRDRRHWWALIPAYTMFVVAGIIGLSHFVGDRGGIIAPYIMFAIAFPFFVVYFVDRRNWWALIPAGIMSLIGAGIFMVNFEYILPIALILGGVAMLVIQLRRREEASTPELPKTGPEADKPRSM
jgi:hypothetical protein